LVAGVNILHPHLRLPVDAGLLCLLFCALLALVQPAKMRNRITEAKNNI
jgi:hypothetical protein